MARDGNDWSISALRMLAMCSIVVCHLCQLYGLGIAWALNIGVQVFLVISGWLYGMRPDIGDIKNWYTKRLIRICVPYWLVLIPVLVIDHFFASGGVTIREVILSVSCIRSGLVPNAAHLWYISAMLFCYLLTPLLGRLWRLGPWTLILFWGVLLLVGGRIVSEGIWCVDYVIAFGMGRLVRDGLPERHVLGFASAAAGGGCLVLWVVDYLTGAFIYTGLHLLGGPLIFSGFRLLVGCNRFEPKELMKRVLKWGDSYSYEVYLVHQLLVLGDFSLSIFFPNSPVAVVSLVLVWSLLAGMVLHHVASPLQKTLITRLTTTQEAK